MSGSSLINYCLLFIVYWYTGLISSTWPSKHNTSTQANYVDPSTPKVYKWNLHPIKGVARRRNPQCQVDFLVGFNVDMYFDIF